MRKKPSIPTSDSRSMREQRLLGRETERPGIWVSEDLLFMIIFSVMFDFFSMSTPYLFLQTPNNKESSKQLPGYLQKSSAHAISPECQLPLLKALTRESSSPGQGWALNVFSEFHSRTHGRCQEGPADGVWNPYSNEKMVTIMFTQNTTQDIHNIAAGSKQIMHLNFQ